MSFLLRWFAVGVLTLVAVTWRLWTPQEVFPQIPLLRIACDCPQWVDWFCLIALVASAVALVIKPNEGRWRQVAAATMAVAFAGFFILDQHRLQPWAWQFFLLAVLFALSDDITARRGWQWLAIGIYFWSALWKFDKDFISGQGPEILEGLKKAIGLRGMPTPFTELLDERISVGLTIGELVVAMFLAWPRARWLGLLAATLMHIILLITLGPWGLNHSWGVLCWNIFFIGQDWLLFGDSLRSRLPKDEGFLAEFRTWRRELWAMPPSPLHQAGILVIALASLWPSLAPFGLCDHWLAWRMYMPLDRPGAVRSSVQDPTQDFVYLTTTRKTTMREKSVLERAMDPDQWSLEFLGAPSYPSMRFQFGIFLQVESALEEKHLFFRVEPSRFQPFKGGRPTDYITPQARQQLANSFHFNCEFRRTTAGRFLNRSNVCEK